MKALLALILMSGVYAKSLRLMPRPDLVLSKDLVDTSFDESVLAVTVSQIGTIFRFLGFLALICWFRLIVVYINEIGSFLYELLSTFNSEFIRKRKIIKRIKSKG